MVLKTRKIENIKHVQAFLIELRDANIAFHPDTPFEDYINLETKKHVFGPREVARLDDLMQQCFRICNKLNIDLYEVCISIAKLEEALIPCVAPRMQVDLALNELIPFLYPVFAESFWFDSKEELADKIRLRFNLTPRQMSVLLTHYDFIHIISYKS